MRPPPSAQTASICGSCLGSSEPESFAMLLVCHSIRSPSLCDRENQAIFATRSPTAIRDIRPFRLRRKQIPETSRSGTWTTRRTRSRLFFDLPFLAMGEGLCAAIGFHRYWKDRLQYARGKIELDPSPMSAKGPIADIARSIRSPHRRARNSIELATREAARCRGTEHPVDQGPLYGSSRWSHVLCNAAASSITLAQTRS